MKRIISLFLLCLVLAGTSYPQVKVKFKLMNPGVDSSGLFYYSLVAVVPTGQTWRVGSSNIRVAFHTVPTGGLTVHPDNPVQYPLAAINSGNYSPLTTTSLNGGVRISFNITRTGACYVMTPGTYVLGRLRFNRIDTTCCTIDTISTSGSGPSVVQDSITALTYPAQWLDSNFSTCVLITNVEQHGTEIPKVFSLYQNYPNPFNPSTTIKFDLPKSAETKLVIYDILGREVARLIDKKMNAGKYTVLWDGTNLASGTYIYKLTAGDFEDVKKMTLVK
jgi:hypothetical protein